jgi:hypothetical protein
MAMMLAAFVFVLFSLLATRPSPQRVGDGSEYYAMFGEVVKGHRTFMTSEGWNAYEHLVETGRIASVVPTKDVQAMFPQLFQKSGSDFNHFWMYPVLAAVTGGWVASVGGDTHAAFLILHALLFGCLLYVAARELGWVGIGAAIVLLTCTPIFWFTDKVHTEFFTFCCVALSTILLYRKRYLGAAAWLALASTQNISIGAAAIFLLSLGLWDRRRTGLCFKEAAMVFVTLALVALHPLYYFFRIGVIDPQLLAGGAKIGGNLSSVYVWFLDPDIGLFPNWPFGILLLILGVVMALRSRQRINSRMLAFLAVFLATNLYAQSSTETLNSGATVDVARYGTWYIGLFIVLTSTLIGAVASNRARSVRALAAGVVLLACGANVRHFNPSRPERYQEPTALSAWLQARHPHIYDPPEQIFIVRNAGPQSSNMPPSYALLGPECAKALVVVTEGVSVVPVAKHWCGIDPKRLPASVLKPSGRYDVLTDGRRAYYVSIEPEELAAAQATLALGRVYETSSAGAERPAFLGDGWNSPESWGSWSQGRHAELRGRLPACPASGMVLNLRGVGFVTKTNKRVFVDVAVGNHSVGSHVFTDAAPVDLHFPVECSALGAAGELRIRLTIHGAITPRSAGLGTDERVLGVGLQRFSVTAQPASL